MWTLTPPLRQTELLEDSEQESGALLDFEKISSSCAENRVELGKGGSREIS